MATLIGRGYSQCLLSEDQVVEILRSNTAHIALAREYGVSPETIRNIRFGRRYAKVRPDLSRWEARPGVGRHSCWNCVHHRVYMAPRTDGYGATEQAVCCGLGLPDPLRHGPRFAAMCASFMHQDDAGQEVAA